MIINIKGASGSGKSTLVRKVMDLYPEKEEIFMEGRKRPIAYKLKHPSGSSLIVLGHYETACGGCDTIKKADDVYDLVRQYAQEGYDVLFEGLLLTADANRATQLHKDGFPSQVIAIDIALEDCIASINQRRLSKWNEKCREIEQINAELSPTRKPRELPAKPDPVNPYHTSNKWKQLKRIMQRLEDAGLNTHWLSRDHALAHIRKEFRL